MTSKIANEKIQLVMLYWENQTKTTSKSENSTLTDKSENIGERRDT